MSKSPVSLRVVRINNRAILPHYASFGAAGADLHACVSGDAVPVPPGERVLIKTGLVVEVPEGYELQVRPRSGLALKHGLTVLNTPGTIDSDYRGEIGVILYNTSKDTFYVNHGDRIAQMVLNKLPEVMIEEVNLEDLSDTDRGASGFGSTGTKAAA